MKSKQEKGTIASLKIFCGPIAEVSLLHRDCFVAWNEGDTRQFLGLTRGEAIGNCVSEYLLNYGTCNITCENVKTPVPFGAYNARVL
jgi:hypothetical protein